MEVSSQGDFSKLKPCYCFISQSNSILDDKVDSIKKSLKDFINVDLDFKVFDLSTEFDISEFINYYSMPSFFSKKKVAVIKHFENAQAFFVEKIVEILEELSKLLKAKISSNDFFNTVLLITSLKDLKDKKLKELILRLGEIQTLKLPITDNLKKWLIEKSEIDGIKFTNKAVSRLLENVNYDSSILKKEYQKLYLYIISEKEKIINETVIDKLVFRIIDMKIFELVDLIGKKDKQNALNALKSVYFEMSSKKTVHEKSEESKQAGYHKGFLGLITLLHRMYKAILYYKATKNKDVLINYIQKSIGHYPFILNKLVTNYVKFSEYYTIKGLINIFKILSKNDLLIRQASNISEQKNIVLKMIADIINQN